ncbi:MAG: glycosyltransferase [Hyphomonas sp.]
MRETRHSPHHRQQGFSSLDPDRICTGSISRPIAAHRVGKRFPGSGMMQSYTSLKKSIKYSYTQFVKASSGILTLEATGFSNRIKRASQDIPEIGAGRTGWWEVVQIVQVESSGPSSDIGVTSDEPVYVIQWDHGRVRDARIFSRLPEGRIALSSPPLSPKAPSPRFAGTVGVVICTRDRPGHLKACLESLKTQSRTPDEIVVVDNASATAETRDVCETAGVRYVREDRPGLDFARNTGLRASTTDLLAFTDDDVVLHGSWMERLADAFDEERVDAVTGLVLPLRLETRAQMIFETHWSFGRGFERIDFTPEQFSASCKTGFPAWDIGAGANMAFRRSVFNRIGEFDEALGAGASGCSDDSEVWYRIVGTGGTCRYEPGAIVFHDHRDTLTGLQSQLRAYMRGHVAALRVQAQRFPGQGNLRRIAVTLPAWYLKRVLSRLRHGRSNETYFVFDEIRGCLEGLVYPLGERRRRLT